MKRIEEPLSKDFLERFGADAGEALASCRRARGRLLELLRGLGPEDAVRMPAPGRWSPADVAEHLVRTERLFASAVRAAAEGREPLRMEPGLLGAEGRPVAPAGTEPTREIGSPAALARALERSGEELEAAVEAARAAGAVERVGLHHGFFGPMDVLDLTRNCAWHLVHHRKGIERDLATREPRGGAPGA